MVKVEGLEKKFREEIILTDVNMSMEQGKIYGLVGMNGSGKTVLMKCICGFLQPTKGSVTVDGKAIGKDIDFPQSLGLMIETPGFIPYMSGKSNLKNLALIRNQISDKEIEEAMELVGLDPKLKKRVSKYSLGMRRRLGIAQAIMEHPRLLILDEPFNGLDVQGVEDMRKLFSRLAVVLYPGLPVIAIVLRERIPEAVSNWNPGSWLMAARSSRMVSGGFPVGIVFLIEIIIFTAVSILSVEKRLCVPVS